MRAARDGTTWFVTGATGLLGGLALRRLLERDAAARAVALLRDPRAWCALAARLGPHAARVRPVVGDVTQAGLALDGDTRRLLAASATAVLHCAADTTFSRPLDEARRVNTAGTAELLALAADWPRLRRVVHVSTAFAVGRRAGTVQPGDDDAGLGWVNGYEQSKLEAERLVRTARGVAGDWLVLRPSTVACDDTRGAVSQPNAVHQALRVYHRGLAAMMPGTPDSALDVVPADWVADAIATLAADDALRGETLHLCAGDGAFPLDRLLDATWEHWARQDDAWRRRDVARPAVTSLDTYRLFERAVAETGDRRLARIVSALSHFVPQLAHPKRFDTSRTDALLGAPAPRVEAYWARMLSALGPGPGARVPGPASSAHQPTTPPSMSASLIALLHWLNARYAPPGRTIAAETPLFEGRLIDSIRVLELIAWTERAIGREIADVDIRMDNFRTAARIAEVFLDARPVPARLEAS